MTVQDTENVSWMCSCVFFVSWNKVFLTTRQMAFPASRSAIECSRDSLRTILGNPSRRGFGMFMRRLREPASPIADDG